jgi:hypothetical protein
MSGCMYVCMYVLNMYVCMGGWNNRWFGGLDGWTQASSGAKQTNN